MKKIISTILLLLVASFCFAQLKPIELGSDDTVKTQSVEVKKEQQQTQIDYLDAFVLGVVEGITEYLPISSTGHLILANSFLHLDSDEPLLTKDGKPILDEDMQPYTLKNATDAYAIVIQIGAILAVAMLYWQYIMMMFLGLIGKSSEGMRLLINLIIAFLPAAIFGLLFHSIIETYLFGVKPVVIALAVGAFFMFAVQRFYQKRISYHKIFAKMENMRPQQSLLIGLLQCVAMWPGTSRSMMTILGGYIAGMSPADSAKFSFLLGLITLSAASLFKIYKDGEAIVQSLSIPPLALGLIVAFVSAILSVKWLIGFLTKKGLAPFAWYRIALAIALSLLMYFDIIA